MGGGRGGWEREDKGKQNILFNPETEGFKFLLPPKFPSTENFQNILLLVELNIIFISF